MLQSVIPRIYFVSVGLFAAFVAAFGLAAPHLIDHALPWSVPPLHARVIGGFYLGGLVLMVGAAFQPPARVWAMLPLAATWTGALLLVSLLWLSEFDWTRQQVYFWWFAYVVFPLAGAWLAFTLPSGSKRRAVPFAALASALALAVLALLLLVSPALVKPYWPWPLPPLLSQVYSGPLFGLALGIVLVARRAEPAEERLLALGLGTFAAAVLVASILHLSLFDLARPVTWIWFGTLAATIARAGQRLIFPSRTVFE